MYRLPVSGVEVILREPAGAQDLLLYEAGRCDTAVAIALITELASPRQDWSRLSVTDLEAVLLLLHRMLVGDVVRGETRCASESCRARVDISFEVERYLAHHRPRAPRREECAAEGEWLRFTGENFRFRIPAAADLLAAAQSREPDNELLLRCVDPFEVAPRVRDRVERAMQALAPCLSDVVEGQCPQCRSAIPVYFDVTAFVLGELTDRAASVMHDVHLLASHYNWPEEKILALPRNRRVRYAAMIADGGLN